MSVLIKGMKMPIDGCKDCIFVNRKWLSDICPFLKREVTGNVERGGFQTDCPLVPVPPHGDLIDRGALLNKLQVLYDEREDEARYTGSKEIKVSWNDAVYQIVDAPTIIPAEEGDI